MRKLIAQVRTLTITQLILGLALVLIVLQTIFILNLQRQILTSNAEVLAYIASLKGGRDETQRRNELFDRAVESQLTAIRDRLERVEAKQGGQGGR